VLELHSIRFGWPFMLWSLVLIPLLVMLYAWLEVRRLRRRPRVAAAAVALPERLKQFTRRHGPVLWCLVGLSILLLATTRPRAVLLLPGHTEAVMQVMDSSGSMRAQDVKPSRLQVAQDIAREFVAHQPRQVKLGIVSASATATVVQAPTESRDALFKAIDAISTQPGSAIGAGLLIGLSTLLPASGLDVAKLLEMEPPGSNPAAARNRQAPGSEVPKIKLEPGSDQAVALVLLTDGQSNTGPDLMKMARVAADRGVRVYTIGMGTPEGTVLKAEGFQARVKLDEAPLKQVAEITRGEYFRAAQSEDIQKIYQSISMRIVMHQHQSTEITALLMFAGMLWVMLGAAWNLSRRGVWL
jgi:Ca-activated chloride channel family protein